MPWRFLSRLSSDRGISCPVVGCKDGRRAGGGERPRAASKLTLEPPVPAKT